MADFTQTIAVAVRCFGGGPSTKWGTSSNVTMIWGTALWGEGSRDVLHDVVKVIFESLSSTDAVSEKQATHYLSEALSLSGDMAAESKQDGSGYYYVFPDRVTDAEDRSFASWTGATAVAGSWSTAAVTTTSWSQA